MNKEHHTFHIESSKTVRICFTYNCFFTERKIQEFKDFGGKLYEKMYNISYCLLSNFAIFKISNEKYEYVADRK